MTDSERWRNLWQSLGATAHPDSAFDSLVQQYSQPERAYHNLRHIQDCLAQFDWARELAEHPTEVEAALWFHDVIYDSRASNNEEQSAAWATNILQGGNVPPAIIRRIDGLIMVTKHQAPPIGNDAKLTADIDLSILGRNEAEFEQYEASIRQEYHWVPEAIYRKARVKILESFLNHTTLFWTDLFRARYEGPARDNLRRLIYRLGGKPERA